MIGRELIRCGEIVFPLRVQGSRVTLEPCAGFDVLPDGRKGWSYRCEHPAPGGSRSRIHPRAGVCHFLWAADTREPWRGVSPLGAASLGGRLAANVEAKLADETSAPSALILPVPQDGGAPALQSLRSDIAAAKGKAVLLEGTASGWDEGPGKGTRHDWQAQRLGPMIPQQLRELHGDALGAFWRLAASRRR